MESEKSRAKPLEAFPHLSRSNISFHLPRFRHRHQRLSPPLLRIPDDDCISHFARKLLRAVGSLTPILNRIRPMSPWQRPAAPATDCYFFFWHVRIMGLLRACDNFPAVL